MPVNIVQLNEYECIKCHYKWINRKNGQDKPLSKRCPKCKQLDWDKGNITPKESKVRYQLRFTVGEYRLPKPPFRPYPFWVTDANVNKLLEYRPSIKDMNVILEPMCYLIKDSGTGKISRVRYDEWYKPHIAKRFFEEGYSERQMKRIRHDLENGAVKDTVKVREYQLQLSRQLVDYFLEKYSAPYQIS